MVILAVDFPSFPRKFCKGEEHGFSLMDMGTGTVLFISGVLARQVRERKNALERIKQVVSNSLPLIVMGVARFVMNKQVNYQEHYSEYGIHWNFFLTLGCVALISACLNLKNKNYEILALLLMITYQASNRHTIRRYRYLRARLRATVACSAFVSPILPTGVSEQAPHGLVAL